jgi:hypothetical protein
MMVDRRKLYNHLSIRLHRTRMRKFPFAIKAAVVCAIPLLACSTYYTLERLQNAGTFLYIAASAALPVLLLGFAGTASLVGTGKRTGTLFWISISAILAPAFFLVAIWL